MINRRSHFIVLLVILSLCWFNLANAADQQMPQAKNGVLYLSDWNFGKMGTLPLKGNWEFYWQQLLTPNDFKTTIKPKITNYMPVPSYFNDMKINGENLPGHGYATLRLVIQGMDSVDELKALYIQDMLTDYRMWINGKMVAYNGVVGKSKDQTKPQMKIETPVIPPTTDSTEIILQISNFQGPKIGIWEPIKLGTVSQIQGTLKGKQGYDLFLFGSLFIMGLYHLVLFILRPKDLSTLYFGIFCLFFSVRNLVTGSRFLTSIMPDFPWAISKRIEFIVIYFAVALFLMFLITLYKKEFHRLVVYPMVGISLLFVLATIVLPAQWFVGLLLKFFPILGITLLYGLAMLFIALFRRRKDVIWVLIGFFFLVGTAVLDMLGTLNLIPQLWVGPLGIFFFIFFQSVLLSIRFSRAFFTTEILSKRMEIILENTTDMVKTKDKLPAMITAITTIFQEIAFKKSAQVDIYVETNSEDQSENVLHFKHAIPDVTQFKRPEPNEIINQLVNKLPQFPRQVEAEKAMNRSFVVDDSLWVPVNFRGGLRALMEFRGLDAKNYVHADENFVHTLNESLAIALDNIDIHQNLEGLVKKRTFQLQQKTRDIQSMLQNMKQGVLTITEGGIVHPEYSAHLIEILETEDIAKRDVVDLLFQNSQLSQNDISQVKTALECAVGEDEMCYGMNSHLLIKEYQIKAGDKTKTLEVDWDPIINNENVVEKIMVTIRDVTHLRELQAQADQQRIELEIIGQILSVSQEKFFEFVKGAEEMIKSNEKLIQETDEKEKEVLNVLFRNMHTIKGNARTYGFLFLTNQVHEAEQTYDDLRKNNEVLWDKDRLLKELNQTLELLQKYSQINENKLGRKGPGRRGSTERFVMVEKEIIEHTLRSLEQVDKNDFAQLKKSINETANMLRLIGTAPIKEVISGILDSLPSLADQTGKAHPIITINDNNIYIKNQVFGLLNNAFMHLYRNSMDHGIETPDERKQKGKNPTGTIELNLSIEEGFLVFRFKDDGKGLAISKIKQKATTIGVITSAENISLQDSANLIFLSGVSTAEKVTDVSGRGVGMDAVKNFFKQEKGDVFIQVLDELNPNQDFVPIQLVLKLPEHFAVKIG